MALSRPVLTLVAERAGRELIQPPKDSNVLEASGVVAKGRYYYVVFDNIRKDAYDRYADLVKELAAIEAQLKKLSGS